MFLKQAGAYSAMAHLMLKGSAEVSPAELQGYIWGWCSIHPNSPDRETLSDFSGGQFDNELTQAVERFIRLVEEEIREDDFNVTLLLPDDNESLSNRAIAISEWCRGFMVGCGHAGLPKVIPDEVLDLFQNLSSLIQMEPPVAEDEESEADLMELIEFVRMAPLLVRAYANRDTSTMDDFQPTLH